MFFDGFANGENLERGGGILSLRGNADAERNRIGAEGQAADSVDVFV